MTNFDEGISSIIRALSPDSIVEKSEQNPYLTEWRGLWHGNCDLVVKPKSTEEIAKILEICDAFKIPVVPQGGNTGLVGGGVPNGGIVVSTSKLNKIREIDPINLTLTCESGCILNNVQTACEKVNRLFPLSLGAEGSCQIGGNLSTNAGGVQVLRYGNTRDLVLGIEAVLPNGQIWNGLRGLRKDNTGYDLKHLFMGAEGTLGIITAATLKLYPRPKQRETSIAALSSIEDVVELFTRIIQTAGDSLTGFELMSDFSFFLPIKNYSHLKNPFKLQHNWYALIELSSPQPGTYLRFGLEQTLSQAIEENIIQDAVLAESETQSKLFWQIRELIPEAQSFEGASIKNDITVPVSKVPEFIHRANDAIEKQIPGTRPVSFGHVGDGNIHYNLTQPLNMDGGNFLNKWKDITNVVNEIVANLDGSFSAEHGIGQLKREELMRFRSKVEIDLMRSIKKTLDPKNIMNPGKVFLS